MVLAFDVGLQSPVRLIHPALQKLASKLQLSELWSIYQQTISAPTELTAAGDRPRSLGGQFIKLAKKQLSAADVRCCALLACVTLCENAGQVAHRVLAVSLQSQRRWSSFSGFLPQAPPLHLPVAPAGKRWRVWALPRKPCEATSSVRSIGQLLVIV